MLRPPSARPSRWLSERPSWSWALVALSALVSSCVPEARAQSRPARNAHPAAEPTLGSIASASASSGIEEDVPPTAAAVRTMQLLERVERTMRVSSYRHDTRVDERAGRYEFDCSGLIAWVLSRTAPAAHRATLERIRGARPLAADYTRALLRVSPHERRGPWTRVLRVRDARAGDVLAWIRPRVVRSNNTGHVVFVTGAPRRSTRYANAWLVPIADSSRYRHQDDSREGTDRTGQGGCMKKALTSRV
jgi:hypothetical protein